MPIPKPSEYDNEDDYIGACMSAQKGEDKPHDQKLAICFSKWESKNEANPLVDILDSLEEQLKK